MSFIISCCSSTDMTKEHYEKYDEKVIGFHYTIDGKPYTDDLGQSMSMKEFYGHIRRGADTSTSQIPVGEYVDHFRKLLSTGQDVLHVTLSSGISSTYQSAVTASEMLEAEFPRQRIYVVDSLCASSGSGLFVDLLAKKRDAGESIKQVYLWAIEHRQNISHWFCSTDLTYYIKGGRVSKVSGVIGGVFQICPLLNVSPSGKLVPVAKIRTKKKVLTALVDKMEQHAEGGLSYNGPCYISNSDCLEDAEFVKQQILARFPKLKEVLIFDIGTTIGCHTGTGTVALFFIGDERESVR